MGALGRCPCLALHGTNRVAPSTVRWPARRPSGKHARTGCLLLHLSGTRCLRSQTGHVAVCCEGSTPHMLFEGLVARRRGRSHLSRRAGCPRCAKHSEFSAHSGNKLRILQQPRGELPDV
jgi:hypothetical protein